MSLQETICCRQNNEDMLRCQFASRYYYNTAEKLISAAFIISFFSALCVFIPYDQKILLLLPIFLDTLALLLYKKMGMSVSSAAMLRNHFDDIVLRFDNKQKSPEKIREMEALIIKAASKQKNKYQEQISHTGRDNPPGVKDWYEFSRQYTDSDVIFECQKQNQWWNKEMYKRRRVLYPLFMSLILLIAFLIYHFLSVSVLEICICFGSAVITFSDRINEHMHYLRLSMKIDNYCEALSSHRDKKQTRKLQDLIESRRELRVVEFNHIHKRNSKDLSEQYEQISSKS